MPLHRPPLQGHAHLQAVQPHLQRANVLDGLQHVGAQQARARGGGRLVQQRQQGPRAGALHGERDQHGQLM
jgi:hypothetical protein